MARFVALLAVALLIGACSSGPKPLYKGPPGEGRFVFDPDNGITRRGTNPNVSEQALYDAAEKAFTERRFDACIELSESLTATYPDGARALDAILLRSQARIEGNRDADEGAPKSVALAKWFVVYMSPTDDPRIQALLARGGEVAENMRALRERSFESFIEWIKPDAERMDRAGVLEPLAADIVQLVDYYLPAFELSRYRSQVAELGRDVAWLAYAAGEFGLSKDLALQLDYLNPPPGVKGDVLFILGQSLRANGAHAFSAQTFLRLFKGANLRDTDTPWRAYGLYWLIVETINIAKGPEYDIGVYEKARDYLGEYKLYLTENPAVPKALRERFHKLIEAIYTVFIDRALDAADTYRRIGEGEARQYYEREAEQWRATMQRELEQDLKQP